MNDKVIVNAAAHEGISYTKGETYYKNIETGVVFGKGMVQGNYLNPQLVEMVAVDDKHLVEVNRPKGRVAGQTMHRDAPMGSVRSRIKSVPHYLSTPQELQYQHKPLEAEQAIVMRDDDGELAREAAAQSRRHAEQLQEATSAQVNQMTEAQRIHAANQQKAEAAQQAVRQTHTETAQLLGQAQSVEPATAVPHQQPGAQPEGYVDLASIGTGNGQ